MNAAIVKKCDLGIGQHEVADLLRSQHQVAQHGDEQRSDRQLEREHQAVFFGAHVEPLDQASSG